MKQGLIGKKLSHSYSKIIHQCFYELTGKNGTYHLFEIDEEKNLDKFLHNCKEQGINHLNVTIPYKKPMLDLMDYLSPQAKKIDAINTIKIIEGKCYGDNTDYYGFIKALEKENIPIKGMSYVILGSGGSSKSVITALRDYGCLKLAIVSRSIKEEGYLSYDDLEELTGYEGLVNTTPVGMYPDTDNSPIKEHLIKNYQYVIDLVYNPSMTTLLHYASKYNRNYANGLYMLVAQAIKAQEVWNEEVYEESLIDKIYQKLVVK